MDKLPESHDQHLDDELSKFTDRLLSGGDEIKARETMQDHDLAELKRTAIRMKAAARMARPSASVSTRVRARLLREWKEQAAQPKRLAFFKALFEPMSVPRFAMLGGTVILLLLSVVTLIVPTTTPLPGAAVSVNTWAPLFIFFGIVLIILIFWFDRRR
jgi:hypothetical protein